MADDQQGSSVGALVNEFGVPTPAADLTVSWLDFDSLTRALDDVLSDRLRVGRTVPEPLVELYRRLLDRRAEILAAHRDRST